MNPLFNLKGKTAWITGGKRVGIKVAETLAQHGADLVISYNKSIFVKNQGVFTG